MTTTDANGIVFLQDTDNISPLHTLINTLQTGTSTAIGGVRRRGFLYAANETARDALLTQYGGSSSNPLWVDVAGTLQRYAGSWQTIYKPPLDATFSLSSVWTPEADHTPALRRRNGVWLFSGRIRNAASGTFTQGNNTLGTIPSVARLPDGPSTKMLVTGMYRVAPGAWTATPLSVDLETGSCTFTIPGTVTTGANTIDFGWDLSWPDAT